MRTTFFFAIKYLFEKRRSSLSAILGIAIGVAILLSFLCLTNGYRQSLVNRILGVSSHIRVMNIQGSPMYNYLTTEEEINNIEGVTETNPLIVKTGLIKKRERIQDIRLLGIKSTSKIGEIIEGNEESIKNGKILIGKKLAQQLEFTD